MQGDFEHPILPDSCRYEIVGLNLQREPVDAEEPYIDLTVTRETAAGAQDRRTLRFWSPSDLVVERGGPAFTGGLVINDVSKRGMERIGVCVDDVESGGHAVRFWARTVEDWTHG